MRDALRGAPHADFDLEVFGVPEVALAELLGRLGIVNAVGKAFGVYKVRRGSLEIDVSLPRRDSKVGAGHRGIAVSGDPNMPIPDAARRRDLTINAMLADPLTDELVDPFDGETDLKNQVLRAVDATTFLEDPLRAVRVVQFAARLGFTCAPSLVKLCQQAALSELPAERIQGEWHKFLLKGEHLAHGLQVARDTGILARVFPEVVDAPDAGPPLDHLRAARDTIDAEGRRYTLMLAGWLAHQSRETVEKTLDRLWLHKWAGYPLRDRVLSTVKSWQMPTTTDAQLRHLATQAELRVTLLVRDAWTGDGVADVKRAETLGIAESAAAAWVQGRDLHGLVPPGPRLGEILRAVYLRQLDGALADREAALAYARELAG